MSYKILSLDGGGVGGLYTAKIIKRIVEKFPNLIKDVDLVAGTSAGACNAAGLVYNGDVEGVYELFKASVHKVFKDSWWDDIKDLGKTIGADYDYTNLKRILRSKFGSTKLGDLEKKILIPSIDLDNNIVADRKWKPKFWNNFQDLDELLVDAVLKSIAAPTYFPTYYGFADGGLAANNPSVAAIATALDSKCANQKLEDISLLSIGTGFNRTYISGRRLDWGISQWAPFLMPVTLDSMEATADYQCKRFLDSRYARINSALKEKVELDDIAKLDIIEDVADEFELASTFEWLEKNWIK